MKNSKIIIVSIIISLMALTSCQKENFTEIVPDKSTILSKELTKDTTRKKYNASDRNSEAVMRISYIEIEKVTYGVEGRVIGIFEKTGVTNWVETAQYVKSPKRTLERIHLIDGMIHLVDANEKMMIELDLLAKEVRFKDLQFDGQIQASYEILGIFSKKLIQEDLPYMEDKRDTSLPQSGN